MTFKQLVMASLILVLLTFIGCMVSTPNADQDQALNLLRIVFWTFAYTGLAVLAFSALIVVGVLFAILFPSPAPQEVKVPQPVDQEAIERARRWALRQEAACQAETVREPRQVPATVTVRPAV